jgi:hypothetical protein
MKQAEKAVMETESRQLYRKLTEKAIGLIAEVGALVTIMLIYIRRYITFIMHTFKYS